MKSLSLEFERRNLEISNNVNNSLMEIVQFKISENIYNDMCFINGGNNLMSVVKNIYIIFNSQ